MLEVQGVSLHYGAARVLKSVSLTAEQGKITCVMGRNGVGKTSLLRAIVGQHPVSGGSVTWDGAGPRPPDAVRPRPPRHWLCPSGT